jgi:hypothetical protein
MRLQRIVAAADFLDQLISHYVLDEGRLVVAHAGLPQALQGPKLRHPSALCLYGVGELPVIRSCRAIPAILSSASLD